MFIYSYTPPNEGHFVIITYTRDVRGQVVDVFSQDWKVQGGRYYSYKPEVECDECGEYYEGDWFPDVLPLRFDRVEVGTAEPDRFYLIPVQPRSEDAD